MEFTKGQQAAYDLIQSGENVALLSPGGTGKSFLVNQIRDSHTLVTAPSGIASINIGGATCHKIFSLGLGVALESDLHKPAKKAEELFAANEIKRVVIDEISLLRGDSFDLIDARLRKITRKDIPFGGLQMILVGDCFQISPVLTQKDRKVFYDHHRSTWFFNTMAYEMGNFKVAVLDEVIRQEDARQQRILESIRKKDKFWIKAVDAINEMASQRPLNAIWLCSYKKQAAAINETNYREVDGTERTYMGWNKGFPPHELPVPQKLNLKVGTRVVIKANSQEDLYQNGTQGVVTDMDDEYIWVRKLDGEEVPVSKTIWEKFDYVMGLGGLERKSIAKFRQWPITYGWAITIHAAQGMTLEAANIDFGSGAFAPGLAYVALSRVKDLTKVFINNDLNYADIIVDPEVKEFYNKLEEE